MQRQDHVPFLAHPTIFKQLAKFLPLADLSALAITGKHAELQVTRETFGTPDQLLHKLGELNPRQITTFLHAHRRHFVIIERMTCDPNHHAAYACWAMMSNVNELDMGRLAAASMHLFRNNYPIDIHRSVQFIHNFRLHGKKDYYADFFRRQPKSTVYKNLCGADLSGLDLSHSFLQYYNLSDANLSHCSLRGTLFAGANLCNANLDNADVNRSTLALAIVSDQTIISKVSHDTINWFARKNIDGQVFAEMLNHLHYLYNEHPNQGDYRAIMTDIISHIIRRQEANANPTLIRELFDLAIHHNVFAEHRETRGGLFGRMMPTNTRSQDTLYRALGEFELRERHREKAKGVAGETHRSGW